MQEVMGMEVMGMNDKNTVTESARTPRVVVVTGASAGVGRATIRAFAREGA